MGTYALSAGYYDAYYKRAQQVGCLPLSLPLPLAPWRATLHVLNRRALTAPGCLPGCSRASIACSSLPCRCAR